MKAPTKSQLFVGLFALFAMVITLSAVNGVNATFRDPLIKSFSIDTTKPPPQVKQYCAMMPIGDWIVADSIWAVGEYYVGRQLTVDQADQIKTNLKALRTHLLNMVKNQMMADTVKFKNPIPPTTKDSVNKK